LTLLSREGISREWADAAVAENGYSRNRKSCNH